MARETYSQPVSQSSIAMCLRCKRCSMFRYRWCIFPKQPLFKKAPSQGTLVHRLLELGPDGVETVRKEVKVHLDELMVRIDQGEDLLGELAKEANSLNEIFHKALVMVYILWEKYPRPEHHKVLAKEEKIEFGLGLPNNMTLILRGTIDEMVLDTQTGLIWIRDFKTSSRNVAFTITGYQYSLQCRIYRLLGSAFLGQMKEFNGRAPEGFILDVLQTPSIIMCDKDRDYIEVPHTYTRGAKKGQTEMRRVYEEDSIPQFDNYLRRCREWYETQGDEAVQSFAIRFTEAAITSELMGDLLTATMAQTIPAVPENFSRDSTASYCKHFDRVCDYYKLCSVGEASWDSIIETDFVVKPPEHKLELEKRILTPKQNIIVP